MNKKIILILFIILIFLIGVSLDTSHGVKDTKKIKKTQPLKDVTKKGKNKPTKVLMNSTHIYVWGAKCSAKRTNYQRHGLVVFKNQNPKTKKWNYLRYDPKGVAEGEFTGTEDRDYCCCHCSLEKSGKRGHWKLLKWKTYEKVR